MDDFFTNKNVKEFLDALMEEENFTSRNSPYVKRRGSISFPFHYHRLAL